MVELSKGYLNLVEEVRTINEGAAEYMLRYAPLDESIGFDGYASTVSGAFIWYLTPQGQSFWTKIYNRIESREQTEAEPKEPLTIADLRRECFPQSYTWYARQPEKTKVPDTKMDNLLAALDKVMPEKAKFVEARFQPERKE